MLFSNENALKIIDESHISDKIIEVNDIIIFCFILQKGYMGHDKVKRFFKNSR